MKLNINLLGISIVVLLLLLFTVKVLNAQVDDIKQLKHIVRHNGVEYIGTIISDDGREVLLETENLGKIYIPKSEIKTITDVKDFKNIIHGEYRDSGPFTTRYAFTTNAHPILKGENYAMLNAYGPEIHFALVDNLSVGLMSTWIASPMILAVKYSLPTLNSDINFSIGSLFGTSGYLNSFRGYGGLHWATITYGDRMNNLSLSGGYAYLSSGDFSIPVEGTYLNVYPQTQKQPLITAIMFSIAAIAKVGTKASFTLDSMGFLFDDVTYDQEYNYISDENFVVTVTKTTTQRLGLVLMPGFRFQKTENRAFQISLSGLSLISKDENASFPFPMFSWYYKF